MKTLRAARKCRSPFFAAACQFCKHFCFCSGDIKKTMKLKKIILLETFAATVEKFLNSQFVQPMAAQLEQDIIANKGKAVIAQPTTAQIVQPMVGQMPKVLNMTTLSNHVEILCRCKRVSNEENCTNYPTYYPTYFQAYPQVRGL